LAQYPPSQGEAGLTSQVDIVVLTAKAQEYGAFFQRLEKPAKWQGTRERPNQYAWTLGTLSTPAGTLKIALALTHEQTNVPAAIAALATFSTFKPRYIVFMGIAGSLDREVRKGDVLIADYVRAYQYGRVSEIGAFEPRNQFQEPTDQALRTNAAAFAQTSEWWKNVGKRPGDQAGHPTLHFGGLASGDAVIENVDSGYFAAVLENDSRLRAVDMEAAGLALAVRHLKESGYPTGLMVLRGISDVPVERKDQDTSADGANRETRKMWTDYAANAAAHFLEQFIRHAFPYSPAAGQQIRKQFDSEVFPSYQSHFVQAGELPVIHSINDETFEPSVLVPRATLETWWRANPLTIRLVSDTHGTPVGYWQILPLRLQAFRGLIEGRLTERQLGGVDILTYQELQAGSVHIYVTALAATRRPAPVTLDLIAFLQLLHSTIGIDSISAEAVSDDPLNLMTEFGMVSPSRGTPISIWVLDSRDQVDRAMRLAGGRLERLADLVPETPLAERRTVMQLLQR
jgi:nucleoside phosphorylase